MEHVYVSDLDGTLLGPGGELSVFARESLLTLLGEGLPFTIATARSIFSVRKLLGDLPMPWPVIEFNGAYLSDYATGRHEVIHAVAPELVPEITAVMQAHGCRPYFSTFDGHRDRLYIPSSANEGMVWYLEDRRRMNDHRLVFTDDPADAFNDQVVCLNAIHREPVTLALMQDLREQFGGRVQLHLYDNMYSPGWFWLTVHDRRATKAHALEMLLDWLGAHPGALTVFGDDLNDIPMFRLARRAIAMENAKDEVKAHATHHIGSNHDDSVVRFILDEWRVRATAT